MADGSSGLSLSEMGISTVKKTAQAVKKQATPFVQGVKQQIIGGQTPPPEPTTVSSKLPSAQPPSESIKSGVFDIFSQVGKQVTSSTTPTQSQSSSAQQVFSPKAAQPPDESGPKMSGTFDLKQLTTNREVNPMEQKTKPQQQSGLGQFTSGPKETHEEKKAKIEALRKQLHDVYFSELERKSKGGEGQQEESVQERLEREGEEEQIDLMKEQEKQKQMAPIVPAGVKGRQGAHEGLKRKG